jgi:hypothetical protein
VSDPKSDHPKNGTHQPAAHQLGQNAPEEGVHNHIPMPPESGAELEPPPDEIAELVGMCVEAVARAAGAGLDFTPDTLPILDHYVSLAADSARARPELLPLLSRSVGAYFGELLRRELPGFWRIPSANVHDWALCARHVFLWINPFGVAFDALSADSEHEGPRSQLHVAPEYRAAVDARLALLPEVPPEEFFLLATRFEVIQLAAETLAVEMSNAGYSDMEYELEDYDAELRPILDP